MGELEYGPERPPGLIKEYDAYKAQPYLLGYAKKIKENLLRSFKLYNGKCLSLYKVDKTGERCPECTDLFTGAKVLSNCEMCGGTGYLTKYTKIGKYWGLMNFNQKVVSTSELGNQEHIATQKDTLVIIDPPLLHDQDLVVFEQIKNIYKIYDLEPQICGLAGEVISQTVQITQLSAGSREYETIVF